MYKIVANGDGGETATIIGAFGIVTAVSSQPWYPKVRELLDAGNETQAAAVHKAALAENTETRSGTSLFASDEEDDLFE